MRSMVVVMTDERTEHAVEMPRVDDEQPQRNDPRLLNFDRTGLTHPTVRSTRRRAINNGPSILKVDLTPEFLDPST